MGGVHRRRNNQKKGPTADTQHGKNSALGEVPCRTDALASLLHLSTTGEPFFLVFPSVLFYLQAKATVVRYVECTLAIAKPLWARASAGTTRLNRWLRRDPAYAAEQAGRMGQG